MSSPFIIYRVIGGVPTWVETVSTLDLAKTHVQGLKNLNRGEYLIYDTLNEKVISVQPNEVSTENSK